jgi:hypothetical protein
MELQPKHKVMIIAGTLLLIGGLAYAFRKKALSYILDKNQEYHIGQLHPDYQNKFRIFIGEIEKMGYRVLVTSSYRTFQKQYELDLENPLNADPGLSHHNYGLALDITLQKGLKIWRKATSKEDWLSTGVPQLANSLGLSWGGYYKNYHDPIHFYYNIDTKYLKQLAITQFGTNPKFIQGNKLKLT